MSKKVEDTKKKSTASTSKRVTDDGWEEEVTEEVEEEVTITSSTTRMAGVGGMQKPLRADKGAAGAVQKTEMETSQKNLKAKDGKVLDMQQTSDKKVETKEMVIPIQIQGRPSPVQQKPKTPKPRSLPFEFPSMPALDMSMSPFDMSMPSASDMMQQMQLDMQRQMSSMMGGMMGGVSVTAGKGQAEQGKKAGGQKQPDKQSQSAEDVQDQDIFVPLRHINKVQKNALSEATAMAKMRDGVFELVVNIQGF